MAVAPKNKTRLAKLVKGAKSVASKVVSGVKSTVGNVISGFGAAASKLPSTINTAGSVVSLQKTPQTSRLDSSNARSQQLLVQSKFQNIQNKGISQSRTQVTPPRTISGSGVSRSGAPSTSTNDAYNTEFGGNPTYSPPTNTSLSTETMGLGTTSAPMPNAPVGANYQGQVMGKNIGLGADPTTGLIQAPTSEEETDTTNKDIFDSYIKALKQPESREKLYNEARQESGIDEAKQRVANTQAQINARTAQMQADILSEEGQGRGIPLDVLDTRRAEISRRAAIDLLPMQAQLAADQGNLEMAEETMNNLFDIYTTDANNSVNFYNKNVEALYNFLTEEEKQKANTKLEDKKYQRSLLQDEIEYTRSLTLQAMKDGNTSLVRALGNNRPPVNVNSPDFQGELQNYVQRTNDAISRYGVVAGGGGVALTPEQQSDPFIALLAKTKGGKPLTDTFAQKLDKGLTVLGQIGLLQENVQNTKTGPLVGAFRGANPWDDNAQTIKAQLNAIVPNLARGVYGEVGVLTDNDIKTYSQTLPNLKSTTDVRNAVLGITVDLISKSVKRTLEVNAANGKDVSGFIDLYSEMNSTRDSIFQQIPGYKGAGTRSLQDIGVSPEEEAAFDSVVGSGSNEGGFFSNLWKGLFGK